jgi:hypothetical protein
MEFKTWLEKQELEEARFKGLQRMFRNRHPDMPTYVQNDLYNTRIGHTLNQLIKNSSNPSSSNGKVSSNVPADSASKIFKASAFRDAAWSKKPEILIGRSGTGVTPADFTTRTREYFADRLFGYRVEDRIHRDGFRTNKQFDLMMQRGEGNNEPVIVVQTMKGFELLEGWHRTMNYLLLGCPKDQLLSLQAGETNRLNFGMWRPVRIQAYIGKMPEVVRALAGTGDYEIEPRT